MIELVNVSKYYPTDFGVTTCSATCRSACRSTRASASSGPTERANPRSSADRGADAPSEGYIRKSGRISPPMGLTPPPEPH